jgi:hypothetical protein
LDVSVNLDRCIGGGVHEVQDNRASLGVGARHASRTDGSAHIHCPPQVCAHRLGKFAMHVNDPGLLACGPNLCHPTAGLVRVQEIRVQHERAGRLAVNQRAFPAARSTRGEEHFWRWPRLAQSFSECGIARQPSYGMKLVSYFECLTERFRPNEGGVFGCQAVRVQDGDTIWASPLAHDLCRRAEFIRRVGGRMSSGL